MVFQPLDAGALLALVDVPQRNRQPAAVTLHGVRRVGGQVHDHLMHLGGIGDNG